LGGWIRVKVLKEIAGKRKMCNFVEIERKYYMALIVKQKFAK